MTVIETISNDIGRSDRSHTLLAAGVLQIAAVLTPAVRVPLVGYIPFFRVPTAGVVLIVLGVLTASVAFRPHGWWRWIPGITSGVVVMIAYWRIVRAPSGTFADVLLRRTVHPAWGFVPMGFAVLVSVGGAALVYRTRQSAVVEIP